MKAPLLLVNLKTYPQGTGPTGLELCKQLQAADEGRSVTAVAAAHLDVATYAAALDIPVWTQHVDGARAGASTGHVIPGAAKDAGAVGTLINHAERQLDAEKLVGSFAAAQAEGLHTVICANDSKACAKTATLRPDYVAVEPPELIGGDISVSTAAPEVVSTAVELVAQVDSEVGVLCGAGIKGRQDVAKAVELGVVGILVASGVVKADDPAAALSALIDGMG